MYMKLMYHFIIFQTAKMSWTAIVVFLSAVAAGNAINRPVYKIALTQKGFAQVTSFTTDQVKCIDRNLPHRLKVLIQGAL